MANPAAAQQDPGSFEDRRAFPRVPVAMPAFLQVDGVRLSVHLLDLSAGGAKLKCSTELPSATSVVLDCGSLCRSAVVRWQNGGAVGICFEEELDVREISALFARAAALEARMKERG